ncbi:hypothetical protein GCM10017771_71290 [Streptomyces capitiformicae]|uniref:Uncharacterized protein n=1 Tax=Streptomyces capitiformicae TaxID=2014920 RepID=A0A918ZF04_9ACTN|nr:hypothetical protein GCM10017771_71290 [Streptomyces capitiformicae]
MSRVAVTVCAAESRFTTVTFVPGRTFRFAGLKVKFSITILAPPGLALVAVDEALVAAGLVLPPFEQPTRVSRAQTVPRARGVRPRYGEVSDIRGGPFETRLSSAGCSRRWAGVLRFAVLGDARHGDTANRLASSLKDDARPPLVRGVIGVWWRCGGT